MSDDKKAAEKEKAVKPAGGGGGINIVAILIQTVLTFAACFGACFLTFQITPKSINVEQIIKQVERPESGSNLPVYSLGEFVVNLADPGGSRFLKTSITVKVYSNEPEEEGGEHGKKEEKKEGGGHGGAEGADPVVAEIEHDLAHSMPALKDLVISTLSAKTADELSSYDTKLALKEEMVSEMNNLLHGKYKVFDLYFTDFIIQ